MSRKSGYPAGGDRRKSTWVYSAQFVLFALLFLGALTNIVLLSIGLGPSTTSQTGPTLTYYQDVLTNPRVGKALVNSLQLAAVTALITVPLAFLSARFILALKSPLTRLVMITVLILPLLSSSVLRMLGFSLILSDSGPIAWLVCANAHGTGCGGLLYSAPAIVIGLISNVFPICVLILFVQLLRIPTAEIMAARNLGANAWDTWWRIEIPRCRVPIIVSLQLCILLVLGDTLAQSILGGNALYTFMQAINDRLKIDEWAAAAAMAILLVLVLCAMATVVVWRMQQQPMSRS
jgi:spermidine/putrescine transport system permease protein